MCSYATSWMHIRRRRSYMQLLHCICAIAVAILDVWLDGDAYSRVRLCRMNKHATPGSVTLTHLQRLESESIHIMREVVSESEKPVMLYSVGKDSAVMLHLARKAFFPGTPPFPLLHVDTTWKFPAMYTIRDEMVNSSGMQLIVHQNPDAVGRGINPFDHGSLHTALRKTEGLKQALPQFGSAAAFGG